MRAATRKLHHWLKRALPVPPEVVHHRLMMLLRKKKRTEWAEALAEHRKDGEAAVIEGITPDDDPVETAEAVAHARLMPLVEAATGPNRKDRRAAKARLRREIKRVRGAIQAEASGCDEQTPEPPVG